MNLGRAFGAIAAITILSRFSGFFRVAIFAAYFGSQAEADIFLSVMMIPEVMYRFGVDGLISSAAVPMFVRLHETPEETAKAFRALFWGTIFFFLPLVIITIIFAPHFCEIMVPGFPKESKNQMVGLLQLISPYILFSMLSSLEVAFLNAHRQFGLPALGPVLVNLAIILGIVLSSGKSIVLVTIFVVIGAVLQFLWLHFLSLKHGGDWRFPKNWREEKHYFIDFLEKTAPVSVWIFLSPIIPLFERYLLSSQPQGSVAILNYCEKILYFPLGILSISFTSAIFPLLSGKTQEENRPTLKLSLWSIMAFLWPFLVVIFIGSDQITEIIYKRGFFNQSDVLLTGNLLRIFAISLAPISAVMVLNRFFFSLGNYRVPFICGLFQIFLQIVGDNYLVNSLGPLGLAWGAVFATSFQLLLLLILAGKQSSSPSSFYFFPPMVAAGLFLLLGPLVQPITVEWFKTDDKLEILFKLGVSWTFLQALACIFSFSHLKKIFLLRYSQ